TRSGPLLDGAERTDRTAELAPDRGVGHRQLVHPTSGGKSTGCQGEPEERYGVRAPTDLDRVGGPDPGPGGDCEAGQRLGSGDRKEVGPFQPWDESEHVGRVSGT